MKVLCPACIFSQGVNFPVLLLPIQHPAFKQRASLKSQIKRPLKSIFFVVSLLHVLQACCKNSDFGTIFIKSWTFYNIVHKNETAFKPAWIKENPESLDLIRLSGFFRFWWSIGDSNPWPQHCQCCALPTALMPRERWHYSRFSSACQGLFSKKSPFWQKTRKREKNPENCAFSGIFDRSLYGFVGRFKQHIVCAALDNTHRRYQRQFGFLLKFRNGERTAVAHGGAHLS